jgi:hypothetical protein
VGCKYDGINLGIDCYKQVYQNTSLETFCLNNDSASSIELNSVGTKLGFVGVVVFQRTVKRTKNVRKDTDNFCHGMMVHNTQMNEVQI